MTARTDVERILDAFLAPDHDVLPDRALQAALDQVDDTPQARRGLLAPRRLPYMNLLARGAAVLVVAAVAIGGLAFLAGRNSDVAAPSPSPIPSPSPSTPPLPTLDATFVSPSYGFQVRYPSGWFANPGTPPWSLGMSLEPGNPISDAILTPSGLYRMRLSGGSIALPSGMTMEQFRAFASPFSSPFNSDPCPSLEPLPLPVTIDYRANPGQAVQKVEAVVSINGCAALAEFGGSIYDVEVIAGGRGYTFTLDGQISPADALRWLASITLEPATALPASPSPGTSPSASPSGASSGSPGPSPSS